MRLNGGLKSETTSEYVRLKRDLKKWNSKCHPEDKISWVELKKWNLKCRPEDKISRVEYIDQFSKY